MNDEITIKIPVARRGTSLVLTITKIAKIMEIDEGDIVEVTIKRK